MSKLTQPVGSRAGIGAQRLLRPGLGTVGLREKRVVCGRLTTSEATSLRGG